MTEKEGSFLEGALLGGITGALVALLFTPKKGEEIREEISKKIDEFRKDPNKIKEFSGKLVDSLEKVVEVLGETVDEAKKAAAEKRKELEKD